MKTILLAITIGLVASSCYKDEVDVATLNNNPFDPQYAGANVFRFDTTYLQFVPVPGFYRQNFQFTVNSALFLSPTAYSVHVKDLNDSSEVYLEQYPVGSNVFTYHRLVAVQGQPLCLELRLSNSNSTARPETVCGTLP